MAETMNRRGFVDTHCHLIPNLDDGPSNTTEALEMADILVALGFTEAFCTPHLMRGSYDNNPERVRDGVRALQKALDGNHIPLTVHAGIEYYLDEHISNILDEPLPLHDDIILVETSPRALPDFVKDGFFQILVKKRLRPMFAHPERCESFIDAPGGGARLSRVLGNLFNRSGSLHNDSHPLMVLKKMGCLFQGNIGSFAGIYGERVRRSAFRFLEMGLYDRLGTDAHHPRNLAGWLGEGIRVIEREIGKEGSKRLLMPPKA